MTTETNRITIEIIMITKIIMAIMIIMIIMTSNGIRLMSNSNITITMTAMTYRNTTWTSGLS